MQPRRSQIPVPPIIPLIVIVFSQVHVGIAATVHCNVTRNGGNADLMCKIPSHMDIVQVTWQNKIGNSYETLMTKSKRFGVQISKPYENRLSVLETEDPGTSAIALSQLEKEDDACFTAIFKLFPDGALKGEVCLPKLLGGVREVICKSPAEFSVTLDPPEIIIQHSEPNGNIIQKGRWVDDTVSPVCTFQLRNKARTRRNVQDLATQMRDNTEDHQDEIFTIECKASGTQRLTITWINEGQPIITEDKVRKTGDLITVTSTLHHSLSTLPEEEGISCNISYNKDNKQSEYRKFDEKNQERIIVRILNLCIALAVLLSVAIFVIWYLLTRKPKKEDKAGKGYTTLLKHPDSNNEGTPETDVKQRKGATVKTNKEKTKRNSRDFHYSLVTIDENKERTPETEIKQSKGSATNKNKEKIQRSKYDSSNSLVTIDEDTEVTFRSLRRAKNILRRGKRKYKTI